MDWFKQFGDISKYHVILSLSNSHHNYGTSIGGEVWPVIQSWDLSVVIHEFCHHFANPIAAEWYKDNNDFKKLCDDSINLDINPQYGIGQTIAGEYITRAYVIKYFADHNSTGDLFQSDINGGFPYIKEVYEMLFHTLP
jgi:hypothetical protein